jgi:membrane fusion protein (multidrug efflux system)
MSNSFAKALLGAVAGALIVGFAWHIHNERAKHEPVLAKSSGGPAQGPAAGKGGLAAGRADAPLSRAAVAVVVAPVRLERLALEIEALGTAHANESIDVTAKVSNLVTAVRFDEGQHVNRGDLLVELDGAQARAELAIAEAAVIESRSQYKRSREL